MPDRRLERRVDPRPRAAPPAPVHQRHPQPGEVEWLRLGPREPHQEVGDQIVILEGQLRAAFTAGPDRPRVANGLEGWQPEQRRPGEPAPAEPPVNADRAAFDPPPCRVAARVECHERPAPGYPRDRNHAERDTQWPDPDPLANQLHAPRATDRHPPEIVVSHLPAVDPRTAEPRPHRRPPPVRPDALITRDALRAMHPAFGRECHVHGAMVNPAPEPRVCPRGGLRRDVAMRRRIGGIRVRPRCPHGGAARRSDPAPKEPGFRPPGGPCVSHGGCGTHPRSYQTRTLLATPTGPPRRELTPAGSGCPPECPLRASGPA